MLCRIGFATRIQFYHPEYIQMRTSNILPPKIGVKILWKYCIHNIFQNEMKSIYLQDLRFIYVLLETYALMVLNLMNNIKNWILKKNETFLLLQHYFEGNFAIILINKNMKGLFNKIYTYLKIFLIKLKEGKIFKSQVGLWPPSPLSPLISTSSSPHYLPIKKFDIS